MSDSESLIEPLVNKDGKKNTPVIKDYDDMSKDTNVDFTITFTKGKLEELESIQHDNGSNGVDKLLKLIKTNTTTNMHLFNSEDKLKKYEKVEEIIDEYYITRFKLYEERKKYLDSWKNKLTADFAPYSVDEYKFYMQLCLENQYINDIQVNHYIDNGCFCTYCTKKRRDIYYKIKCGEKINEKIIHSDIVQEEQQKVKKNILNIVNKKIALQKFRSNQFSINVNHK
jgi:hypothetical protein